MDKFIKIWALAFFITELYLFGMSAYYATLGPDRTTYSDKAADYFLWAFFGLCAFPLGLLAVYLAFDNSHKNKKRSSW